MKDSQAMVTHYFRRLFLDIILLTLLAGVTLYLAMLVYLQTAQSIPVDDDPCYRLSRAEVLLTTCISNDSSAPVANP